MKKLLKNIFYIIVVLGLTYGSSAMAAKQKSAENSINSISSSSDELFKQAHKDIEKIRKELTKSSLSKESIDAYVSLLSQKEAEILEVHKDLDKQIKFTQKQLDALGEGPVNGDKEDIAITLQREDLTGKLAIQDRIVKEADLLLIQMEDLTSHILNVRNQKIYGDMMTRQPAFINPVVFFGGIKAYVIFFWDVVKSPVEWYKNLPEQNRSFAIFSVAIMFIIWMVALTLAILIRKFILRNWGYKSDIEQPSFNRKVIAAIAVAIARGLIFAFLISGFILWMISTKIFADSFLETILMTTSFATLFAIAETTISRVTFAPNYPQWRLVSINNEKAIRFTRMIFTFILINTFATIQVMIAQKAQYSAETIQFVMIISGAIKASFLTWFAKIVFDTYQDEKSEDKEGKAENTDDEESAYADHSFKMILGSHLFCLITFGISLFGYPELSLFILNHIILTLILCGIFEIFRRSLIEIMRRVILSGPWMKSIKNRRRYISKIEFWLKAMINPILVIALIFSLLNLWGLPGDFILAIMKKLIFGIRIGGMEISLLSVALSIIVFFTSLTLARLIRNKLANNVLTTIDMDDGVKHSLISGISFLGFVVSILLAIVTLGIDLTNLAFIAGALSVGIGFGLQDVIKNLVAGVIILLERPFRVGDWVVLSGAEGNIKQINIRSTELLSFDKTSVIIPNSTLISSSVVNKTHSDNMTRQSISVGVSYNSNPEQVRDILLDCASKFKGVLKNPAPYVLFKDFGDSSLDFELRFYLGNITKDWTIPSSMRYEIFRRFNEEGIEIPFPQVVINQPTPVKKEQKDTQ